MTPVDVTLGQVARQAGVSPATASRALNGKNGVKPDVRERVKIIADALGYRPNRAARNLAGGRTSVIGLIIGSSHFRDDFYATTLVEAVAFEADRHDEGLMLLTDSKSPSTAVRNMVSDGLVEGVIVGALAAGDEWVVELIEANVPTVLVGAHPPQPDVCVVDVETLRSTADLVGHMIDSGCERLAILTGPSYRQDALTRLDGFRLAHSERDLAVDEDLVFRSNYRRRSGYDLSDTIIESGANGVFASNDDMAFGLFQGLRERHVSVPGDISLAGFDGTFSTDLSAPELTTIVVPYEQLAQAAVRSLVQLIDGETPAMVQMIEPEIRFGETTRPPNN